MEIIYTEHSKDRLRRRLIKKEWVEEAIKNPDRLVDVKYDRKQVIKKIKNDKVSVIYTKEGNKFIVITVFWGE